MILIYGAHLLRNGAAPILERMMERGWLTHLATNGAGTIHDWEYAWLGRSTESVAANVATGTFGTWDETGRNIHLALLAGGLRGEGYGTALGRFIAEDGATLPDRRRARAGDPRRAGAPADARPGRRPAGHPRPRACPPDGSTSSTAGSTPRSSPRRFAIGVPMTVHPGIGYDIIANHPVFNGAAIGRAAAERFQAVRRLGRDARRRRGAVDRLGHHGPAGLREEPELRQQPAASGGPADRRRTTRSTSSTSRTAAAGTGPRASRPRPIPPTTCGSARAIPGWAARCITSSATTRRSSTTFTTGYAAA